MDKLADIKHIWRDRFGDSRQWMSEVFSRIYTDEDAITFELDDKVVSSLLLRPFDMAYKGREMPVGYIYGAATSRSEQSKGYMSRLMVKTLREAYRRGQTTVLLCPSRRRLYGFYARFGFTTVLFVDELRYTATHCFHFDKSKFIIDESVCDMAEIAKAYKRLSARRGACLLHNENDFKAIFIDNDLDHGAVAIARSADSGEIVAIGLSKTNATSIVVTELVGIDEEADNAVLSSFAKRMPGMMTVVEAYPQRSGVKMSARGMARIVNLEAFLRILASVRPELHYVFKVTDPIIAENNGLLLIDKGNVSRIESSETIDLEVSIDVLTAILFSKEKIGDIFNLPTARPFVSMLLD